MIHFLLSFQILLGSGKPLKGASMACREIPVYDEEHHTQMGGWMIETDSAGVMYFEGYLMTYHCELQVISKESGEWETVWFGTLTYTEKHKREVVIIE